MDSTDVKAYGEAFKKIWPNVVVAVVNKDIGMMVEAKVLNTMADATLEIWKAAKEHYEKEYSIPKAERKL